MNWTVRQNSAADPMVVLFRSYATGARMRHCLATVVVYCPWQVRIWRWQGSMGFVFQSLILYADSCATVIGAWFQFWMLKEAELMVLASF